ncbi:MAG: hypothetical protein OEZ47_13365 [Gammaproteobacteria bacterium]|nr:hypothetical protein [Gammaproteobacteria bacterium]
MRMTFLLVITVVLLFVVSPQVLSEEKIICGENTIRHEFLLNGEIENTIVSSMDSSNQLVAPNVIFPGAFLSLCKNNRFLLLDDSVHHSTGVSFLLNADLSVVKKLKFGEISQFGKTHDEKYFWIQYFEFKNLRSFTVLSIYDLSGNRVEHIKFDSPKKHEFRGSGNRYLIDVLSPDLPG